MFQEHFKKMLKNYDTLSQSILTNIDWKMDHP